MSEIANDEPDATRVTDFVHGQINSGKSFWKFRFDATVPRLEVFFMSQLIIFLIFLNFRLYKLSLTQLSCEETSVWFSIVSGLIG